MRNYGPGVPRRQLARIFEPFFRGEQEITRRTRGGGIGLALVKELGKAMGADVKRGNLARGSLRVSISFSPSQTRGRDERHR